ncbi:MAG: sodium:solute symporter [Candidatus Binatia bacterium]
MHIFDYSIVILYLLAMVFFGLRMRKKASEGIDSYFLGNRSMPWWMLGSSGMASNFDVAGTAINTALFFVLGISGYLIEIRGGIGLYLAFLMIVMGKWNRRSQVMTFAEWMHLRFGKNWQGDMARIIAAIGMIVITIAMVTYFATGAGKFIAEILGIRSFLGLRGQFWAALLMIVLALVYTVSSGLYGVLLTDVFQCGVIFFAVSYFSYLAMSQYSLPEVFSVSIPLKEGGFELFHVTRDEWTKVIPSWKMHFPSTSDYAVFNLFGLSLLFYVGRTLVDGFSGGNGYSAQRYFAARTDQEVGWLSLLWIFLLSFRWPFIVSIAVMGIIYGQTHGVISDPETVLSVVIREMIPPGVKGVILAALMAAAMSTFDSTVNAGASYWVKDIYQAYFNPRASERQLIRQSRWVSVVIVAIALLLSLGVRNINAIWGWITMAIGVGFFLPMVIRWYWWRMNGFGFAVGAGVGMLAGFLVPVLFPDSPVYVAFAFVSLTAFFAVILGSYLTRPTDPQVLKAFYRRIRPFGFWGPVRNRLHGDVVKRIHRENRRDILAVGIAVPWQLVMFLIWITLILRQWVQFGFAVLIFSVLSIGLYFGWYRYLGKEVKTEEVVEL